MGGREGEGKEMMAVWRTTELGRLERESSSQAVAARPVRFSMLFKQGRDRSIKSHLYLSLSNMLLNDGREEREVRVGGSSMATTRCFS